MGPSLVGSAVDKLIRPAARFLSDRAEDLSTDIAKIPHWAGPVDRSRVERLPEGFVMPGFNGQPIELGTSTYNPGELTRAEQTYRKAPWYKQLGYSALHGPGMMPHRAINFMASVPQIALDIIAPEEGTPVSGVEKLTEEGRGLGQMFGDVIPQVQYMSQLPGLVTDPRTAKGATLDPSAIDRFHESGGTSPIFAAGMAMGGVRKAMKPVIPQVRGRYKSSNLLPETIEPSGRTVALEPDLISQKSVQEAPVQIVKPKEVPYDTQRQGRLVRTVGEEKAGRLPDKARGSIPDQRVGAEAPGPVGETQVVKVRKAHWQKRQDIEAADLPYKEKLKLFQQNNRVLSTEIKRLNAREKAKVAQQAPGRAQRAIQGEITRLEGFIRENKGDVQRIQAWRTEKKISDTDYARALQKLEDRFTDTGSFKKPKGFVSSEATGGPPVEPGGLPVVVDSKVTGSGKVQYTLSNGGIIRKDGGLYGVYQYKKPGGRTLRNLGKAKSLQDAIKIAGGIAAAGITGAVVSQMSEEKQQAAIETGKGIGAAGLGLGAFVAFAKSPKIKKAAEAKIKSVARPVIEDFLDYSENIRVNPLARNLVRSVLGPNQPLPGIATRLTKTAREVPTPGGGTTKVYNVVPSIRKSGIFVERAVQDYTKYKDIPSTWTNTMDPTRAIQGIDGALSLKDKVAIGGSGPIERNVLWRTRDLIKMRSRWLGEMEARGKEILKGTKRKDLVDITREVEFPGSSSNPEIARKGQLLHQLYDEIIQHENDARIMRAQKPIAHRKGYSPHIIREATIWDRGFGVLNKTADIFKKGSEDKPMLPDFIRPNKPFNPRELARRAGMGEFSREMRPDKLLEGYINTAARDIFNTTIIENNKAMAQQLESMGFNRSAAFIQDWTAESFAGVTGRIDRSFMITAGGKVAPNLRKAARGFRKALVLGAFPLNVGWNLAIQTGSAAFTVPKYGIRNTALGMFDWFTNKELRGDIRENAYSYIIKTRGKGRMSTQDINRGMAASARINKSALDKVTEVASLLSDVVENNLTGFSVAAARRHGRNAGLKGQALWEYASEGGSKTQSMYNLEDLPGLLRNEVIKTTTPFQTFKFEAYNNMKEWAGRAGVSPENTTVRTKQLVEFMGAVVASNMVTNTLANREPWGPDSFVPVVYDMFAAPVWAKFTGNRDSYVSKRGLPAPTGMMIDFATGAHDVITKGSWDRLRKASTRYLPGMMSIPGGTQMNRLVDAWIANAQGGVKSGTQVFPISSTKEKIRSYVYGPWSTTDAQKYLKKNEKTWLQAFGFKEPTVLQALGIGHSKFTGALGLTKKVKTTTRKPPPRKPPPRKPPRRKPR
jgi:hypothetical protein